MMEAYKTIQGTAQARIEEKKSEFIAHAAFADTEEKALAFLNGIRAKHRTANHNVYAYILRDGARMRYSDDGEPAGTAGIPMLTALQRGGLTDVVAVVTRYFGGVKLGAGGLVRAYTDAVAQAMDATGLREVRLSTILRIDVDFASAGAVEDQLRGLVLPSGTALVVDGVEWSDRAHIRVAVPSTSVGELDTALAGLSAGSLAAVPVDQRWTDVRRVSA